MAKSIIKNAVEFDIEKIKRFTEIELAKLADAPMPFCYQVGPDTLIVGKYKVIKKDDKCWQVSQGEQQIFDFFSRKDAIFYCIALHKKDNKLATDIQHNDQQLGRLEFDAILYRSRYKKAQEKQDEWKIELYSNKYTETMEKIADVKKQLKKSINSAKYIKV